MNDAANNPPPSKVRLSPLFDNPPSPYERIMRSDEAREQGLIPTIDTEGSVKDFDARLKKWLQSDPHIPEEIVKVNGGSYLTVQRSKHRKLKPTPDKDLFIAPPFDQGAGWKRGEMAILKAGIPLPSGGPPKTMMGLQILVDQYRRGDITHDELKERAVKAGYLSPIDMEGSRLDLEEIAKRLNLDLSPESEAHRLSDSLLLHAEKHPDLPMVSFFSEEGPVPPPGFKLTDQFGGGVVPEAWDCQEDVETPTHRLPKTAVYRKRRPHKRRRGRLSR